MRPERLSPDAIAAALARLNAGTASPWACDGSALRKTWVFADFAAAFAFMTRVAVVAERLEHHPDWRNVWNRVEVALTTHDAGGLTDLDFALASAMDDDGASP